MDDNIVATTESDSTRDELARAYDELVGETNEPEVKAETPAEVEKPAETEVKAEVKPETPAEGDAPKDEGTALDTKAPSSWSPAVREKFNDLPEEVRNEIVRRERNIDSFMQQTAPQRQIADRFMRTVQPYAEHLQSLQVDPYEAIGSLLTLGQKLTTGDARTKAEVLGELFSNYGVDIETLNDVLIDRIKAPQQSPTEKALLQKLERIEQRIAQPASTSAQDPMVSVNTQIEEFASDPKNEFFADVKNDMALLLQSGKAKDLKDAYEKACRMNDEVFKVTQTRAQQQAARVNAGGVSLKSGTPKAAAKTTRDLSTRDMLSQAWDDMVGQ